MSIIATDFHLLYNTIIEVYYLFFFFITRFIFVIMVALVIAMVVAVVVLCVNKETHVNNKLQKLKSYNSTLS